MMLHKNKHWTYLETCSISGFIRHLKSQVHYPQCGEMFGVLLCGHQVSTHHAGTSLIAPGEYCWPFPEAARKSIYIWESGSHERGISESEQTVDTWPHQGGNRLSGRHCVSAFGNVDWLANHRVGKRCGALGWSKKEEWGWKVNGSRQGGTKCQGLQHLGMLNREET